jgi:hypothetical protein
MKEPAMPIDKSGRFPEDEADIKNRPANQHPNARPGEAAANEGEGNKSADRRYRAGVIRTIQSGKVDSKAKEAERAVAGPEGEALRRAEEAGRRHSHGEDPELKK